MNERIKELAKQADEGYTGNSEYDMGDALVGNDAIKKFAELIGKEYLWCIDIMEKISNSSNASIPEGYDKYTYLKTLDDLKGLLKVHFGGEG